MAHSGKSPEVSIADNAIQPGERRRLELKVARLPTGGWLSVPVEVVCGARPGPRVWLSGALHGDELDGTHIVGSVLRELTPEGLSGSVIGLPVVNVFGFVARSRYLPDRRDLNRSFPGRAEGSLAAQIAHLIMAEVVQQCELGLDFHCGSDDRTNLPQIRADLDDSQTREAALAFGAPVMIHGDPPAGSLRSEARKRGARVLLYEGGEAHRFTSEAIDAGQAGALRVLAHLGMVSSAAGPAAPPTLESRRTRWIRARRSGLSRLHVPLGARVQRGERLGSVHDLYGDEVAGVHARGSGLVIAHRLNPMVTRGDALVHIAELS